MQVNVKVKRFNPETDNRDSSRYQEYSLEMESYATVLDALIQVREEVDGSLALRCSCRSAICGSCAMRINGHASLACKVKVVELAPKGEQILVEPMGNMPLIKDLVTDMQPFWNKVKAVKPWLMPSGPPPEGEYIAPNSAMLDLAGVMNCIMCGACVSDCTSLEVHEAFLGPAALAKAYRFVGDPRDDADKERLKDLSEHPGGIWHCTHCFECVQVCPKGVAPMEKILALRREAVEAGYTDNSGTRHSDSFAKSVKNSGWLNETKLAVDSYGGIFNVKEMLRLTPTAIRATRKGKSKPWLALGIGHHSRPKAKNVKKIFEKLEGK